jgi:hypothetical protein
LWPVCFVVLFACSHEHLLYNDTDNDNDNNKHSNKNKQTNKQTQKQTNKQNYLRDGDGDAVKGRLSLDSVHNDSSATKHINQNLHPINCTLTFHRNLQRQKCRQSNKQTNKLTKKYRSKQTNTNIRSKQTTRNQNKPIKG